MRLNLTVLMAIAACALLLADLEALWGSIHHEPGPATQWRLSDWRLAGCQPRAGLGSTGVDLQRDLSPLRVTDTTACGGGR